VVHRTRVTSQRGKYMSVVLLIYCTVPKSVLSLLYIFHSDFQWYTCTSEDITGIIITLRSTYIKSPFT
jgi:hypothetical protein